MVQNARSTFHPVGENAQEVSRINDADMLDRGEYQQVLISGQADASSMLANSEGVTIRTPWNSPRTSRSLSPVTR